MTTTSEGTPRIYVASLSDYNTGRLHGVWIDANQSAEEIHEGIRKMLAESKEPLAEEWAIHDYEGFGDLRLSESEDMEDIAAVVKGADEHGPLFFELAAHFGGLSGLEDARRYMVEAYCGEYDDLGWYAAQLGNDLYHEQVNQLPDFIRSNIDWDAIGDELEMAGDIFTIEIGRTVHVFDANL